MDSKKLGRYSSTEECDFYANLAKNTNVFGVFTYKQHFLTREKVSGSISHLIHRMNRELFGNNYRRYEKSIGCVPFIEKEGHLHSNLLLRVPDEWLNKPSALIGLIKRCHKRTICSDRIIDIHIHDNNVKRMVNYSLKEQVYDKYLLTTKEIIKEKDIVTGEETEKVNYLSEYKPKWSYDFSYDAFDDLNLVMTDDDCNLIKQTSLH
jgi:hypothetical protein